MLTRVEPNATLPTQTTHTAKQQSCSTLTRVEPNATIKNIQRVFRNDRACSTLTRVEPNATMTGTRAEPAVTTTCSTLTRVEPNATVPTNTIIAMPFPLAVPSLGSSPTQPWSERRSVVLSVVLQYPHSGRAQRNERIRRIAIRNISFLQYPHSGRAQRNMIPFARSNVSAILAVPSLGSSPTQRHCCGEWQLLYVSCSTLTRVEPNATWLKAHKLGGYKVLAVPSLGSSPTQRGETVTPRFKPVCPCSTLTRVEPNATRRGRETCYSDCGSCSTLTRVEPNATGVNVMSLSFREYLQYPHSGRAQRNHIAQRRDCGSLRTLRSI